MMVPIPADYSEAEQYASALLSQVDAIGRMCPMVAKARTVLAYSSDRLKRALAMAISDAQTALFKPGEKPASFAAAESKALTSTAYRDAVDSLASADEQAEQIVAEWQAAMAKKEALTMVVSLEKQKCAL